MQTAAARLIARRAAALCGLLACVLCNAGRAQEVLAAPSWANATTLLVALPKTFRLDELTIRLVRQNGNAAYAPQQLLMSSQGGSLQQHDRTQSLRYSAADLIGLLNQLLRLRFFDLPQRNSTRQVAMPQADGLVSLGELSLSNANTHSVCVALGAAEHCVRYGSEAPQELDQLVQRVFADAERLAAER